MPKGVQIVGVAFRVFRNGPKNSGHNINIYAEVLMEIFALEGDLS